MGLIVTITLLCLLIFLLVHVFLWVYISQSHFTSEELIPGCTYQVAGREYTFPNVDIHGKVFRLKDVYIESLRDILTRLRAVFEQHGIDYWLTGGTLLGSVRHTSIPMPFDDDMDIAVLYEHKRFLYSKAFAASAEAHGLKAIYFVGNNEQTSNKIGSAVRVQLLGSGDKHATCDIFFWSQEAGQVIKLDGWHKDKKKYSNVEIFPASDVFTLQKNANVDGLTVNLPRHPVSVLEKQYGPKALTSVVSRCTLVSHYDVQLLFLAQAVQAAISLRSTL